MPVTDQVTFASGLSGILTGTAQCGAVLISHGAGGTMMTPLLVQTATKLNDMGFLTLRWNFGYVAAGRPASAGGKRELPEMTVAVDFLAEQAENKPIILLGKSFGGRLSTHIASERDDIGGLVLYGLPVRGMGKNPKPRDWSHLGKIKADVLFITGDKDQLCPQDELAAAQKYLTKPFVSEIVPGDHSYKPRGEAAAQQACLSWMRSRFC
jgi:hypothetical protein